MRLLAICPQTAKVEHFSMIQRYIDPINWFVLTSQLVGEREVLGQVKLAFTNTNGAQMICTRSMQFTLKRVNGTFKTLEGQLLVMANGQRKTISTRCADLDAQMPLYLGVSKAVLDNVIFCHQEESLWPLSEPSVLKKKFDEIFEAMKFTKVIDNIKALRKEYSTDIKIQQTTTEHLKTDKERAERMEEKANQLLEEIELYKEEAQKLEEEMQIVTEESNELFSSNQKFQKILYELESLKHEDAAALDALVRLKNSIDLLQDSDSDLGVQLETFEAQSAQMKQKQEMLELQLVDEKALLDTMQRQYNETIQREGKLNAENDAYKGQLVERQKMLNDLAQQFNLKAGKGQKETIESLEGLYSAMKGDLDLERASNLKNENEMTKIIQEITTDKLREEQKVISYRNSIRDSERKSKQLQSSIESIQIDEGTLTYSQQLISALEQKLAASQTSLERIITENRIPALEAGLQAIEDKKDALNKQLTIVNEEAESRTKLAFLREDISRREKSQQALIDKNMAPFSEFGIELDKTGGSKGNVEQLLREAIAIAQNEHESCVAEEEEAKQNASKLEMRIGLAKDEQRKFDQEITSLGSVVEKVLGVRKPSKADYETRIQELVSEEQAMSERVQELTSYEQTARAALGKAESEQLCFICQRKFDDLAGLEAFEERLRGIIAGVERAKQGLQESQGNPQEDLEIAQENLAAARKIAPEVSRLDLLITELMPKVEQSIMKLTSEFRQADARRKQLALASEEAQEGLARVELLRRAASDMARGQNEIGNARMQIEDLISQLKSTDEDSPSLTSTEILQALALETERSKKLRSELNEVMSERDKYQTQISKLQTSIADKKADIAKFEKQLEEKEAMERTCKELRESVANYRRKIASVELELEEIEGRLREQRNELDGVKLSGAKREKELTLRYTAIKDAIADLNRTSKLIEEYEISGRERELFACREMVQAIGEQVSRGKEQVEELTEKRSHGEKALMDLKGVKRNLEENISLRNLEAKSRARTARIKELEGMNAERDRQKYEEESLRLRNKHTRLSAQLAGKMGEVKQMDDQLRQVNDELETEFKDVADEYRGAVIKLRATSVANDDLAKYSRALEAAIMKYHSMKMAEVNEIIDELWKKTYSGSDVDTILIRSESEASATKSATTMGNRAYNYRVCMVKQDVELDMRGRCSAGQKVLASIIIRLALAQCFGVNCGLIALDEPTTNLDSDNIESLAKALSLIISQRREQSNFQLIVITHDEKFLTHMNAAAYTDHFFRVSRNERQKSQIQWVPISRVME